MSFSLVNNFGVVPEAIREWKPLMAPQAFHPFGFRLRLIAKQVLQYRHMYKVDPAIERIAQQVLAAPDG